MMDFISQFRSARRRGVPLVAVQTPDPAATIEALRNASAASSPVVLWDACQGWQPGNKAGRDAMLSAFPSGTEAEEIKAATLNPTECMVAALRLPSKTVLFALNAHRYLADNTPQGWAFVQSVWTLRDAFKADTRTVVLLGPDITLPPELSGDVLVLIEPLPNETDLAEIVGGLLDAAEIKRSDALVAPAVEALRGLAAFSAEQATALAISDKGELDHAELWRRKEQMINATPGLSIWKGGDTLDDVGGCEQVKRFITMKANGKQPFQAVVFIDEGEKAFAGATAGTGDSSGVSQGFLGTMLTWQQDANDRGSTGMIFVGPPGAAKSMLARAVGATFGVPTIALDLGGMKASLVGESEARLRAAQRVIDAVAERVLVIMTCNKAVALPPELKRRYKSGTFYFDLLDEVEAEVVWSKYLAKYELGAKAKRPADCKEWTGAEIKVACELAWDLGLPLEETGQFIVPVCKSAAEEIAALRKQADQRYLSASQPGPYVMGDKAYDLSKKTTRSIGKEGLN